MNGPLLVLVPLLVLPVVLLVSFVGCVGDEPELRQEAADAKQNATVAQQKADAAAAQQAAEQAAKIASKYENVVLAEPDLVSYWRLGDTIPTVAADSAPDAPKNGTYNDPGGISLGLPGVLTLGSEPDDKAVQFDGVHGLIEVPYDMLVNPPAGFTVEAWVRPEAVTPEPQAVISSYEIDPASGNMLRGFIIEIVSGATRTLRARIGNGTPSPTELEAPLGDGLEHDQWRHIAVTYDPTQKQLKLYVNADDGKSDAELGSPTADPVSFIANQAMPLRIAAGQVEGPTPHTTPARLFQGRIDEVALYRYPLSGSNIKAHFLAAFAP